MQKTLKTWTVTAGTIKRVYFTEYHAEQMARALRLNGMNVEIAIL